MEHRRRHRRTGDRRGGAELTAEPNAARRSAGAYTRLIRPVLFRRHGGDAERVHEETLRQLAAVGATTVGRAALRAVAGRHRTPTTVAGIDFPGLVGVAAGLDKNGVAARSWAALGFGFAELGTVTAQPQPGNETPRLFRLPASEAIINRMGFNNAGAQALADRLRALGVRRGNGALGMPVGISIGKTKIIALDQAVPDYLASLHAVADVADYVAVNVSSPNTPGLRRLQDRAALHALLSALVGAAGSLPIMVKIAPDLDRAAVDEAVDVCTETGVAGLIATNTTLGRDGLRFADLGKAAEVGGLSGAPLTARAREVVGWLTASTGLPVIGVGGIGNVDDAQALLDAGAGLVQLYTGFIYQGPGLVRSLNRGLRPSGSVPPPTSRSLLR